MAMSLNNVPTAGGGITRAAYILASQAQVSVVPLLRRADLSIAQVKNPRARIPVRDQIKFLNLVADELRDEFIGIRLAGTIDLRELGLLYYVMASSKTLGDALGDGHPRHPPPRLGLGASSSPPAHPVRAASSGEIRDPGVLS